MTSPASKYARLVISAMLAMHRYAPLCRVRWEEVESAHLKSSVAAPSCSAPSPATMHGSYASPCDETSTSSGRQAAWAGTGRTGVIGRCGTPADSSKVVSNEHFAHEHCGRDGCMQCGQRDHLRAAYRQMAALSSQECTTVRIRKDLLHLQSSSCRGRR